jgi:glycosyltransferase involved in cell wall biosynthesis
MGMPQNASLTSSPNFDMSQKLLFVTPKIDETHDDLAFASLWAKAFQNSGFDVTVICTNKGPNSLTIPVYSLGGERGASRALQFLRFQKLIVSLKYDRVFVHMTPRWLGAGAWLWMLRRIPAYLWFTHYTRTLALRIGEHAVKRMFAATKDSLPQYEGDPRKVVTGHGIDTMFWDVPELPENEREPATHLLAVHRISRSKRLELILKALAILPPEYRLTHYGRPQDPRIDPAYAEEIETLVRDLKLSDRVKFMGSRPMPELRAVYPRFRTFINMVPKTIDKTALEAMYAGLTPVLAPDQAEAIGWKDHPVDDSPEAIADFIRALQLRSRSELRQVVQERHSLSALIEKMAVYIRPGK